MIEIQICGIFLGARRYVEAQAVFYHLADPAIRTGFKLVLLEIGIKSQTLQILLPPHKEILALWNALC